MKDLRFLVFGVLLGACSYAPLPPLGGDAGHPDAAPVTSCTPNEFVDCYISSARICNSEGNGVIEQECGAPGCNMAARRCNECTPSQAFCSSDELVRCGADGLPSTSETCALGCGDSPSAHCMHIQPTYEALAAVCDTKATQTLQISTTQTIVTNSPSFCSGGIVSQTSGPDICIARFRTITVGSGVTLKLTGNAAVAMVADDALTIDGTIDVSADLSNNGPGAQLNMSGGEANTTQGGGGAGFKTAGAAGGNGAASGGAANGGPVAADPATSTILAGGFKAGGLSGGGGGGGALALISCNGTVLVSATATLTAGGGGGAGGYDMMMGSGTMFVAGSGGGSGGNIVLQGVGVTVLGKVFANGGGGGGATSVDNGFGTNGEGGRSSASTPAAGGSGTAAGSGGNGGIGSTAPTVGQMGANGTAGGGGGSVGFLQTFTPAGVTPTITPAEASPAFQPNRTLQLR